jgi:predicted AlkP superfamily phosphohydrolase/phosphomutase
VFLIVGLDGATLDLVEPWVAEGILPNLAGLMQGGAWGQLMAPMPPVTFPSWTTFMTGVNPGRHGIFDFTRRDGGAYAVRFVNATFRKAPTMWRLMSDAGLRVCSLGIPGNYPPEPLNGYNLSGFDTPVTTRADASFAHPPSFAADVERAGGFPFADFQEFSIGPGWHRRALAAMQQGIERKTELALELLGREDFACFMLLFGESDTAAHHFWSLHDERSPRFDRALREELGDGLRDIYRRLDSALGRLLDAARPSRVLIVSDHGFGGVGDVVLRLNRWLAEHGFLSWRQGSAVAGLAGRLRAAALKTIPERLQAPLFRLAGGRLVGAVESRVRFGGIDWSATRAFSEELNYNPSIWLNVAGRDQRGVVRGEEYETVCADLRDRLLAWRDPLSGGAVVRRVWHRDELYRGECVDGAPDLTLELETPGGYSYMCLPSGGADGPVIEKLGAASLLGGKLTGMSGSHRREGIFVLAGEGVAPGRVRGARMTDMAPTVLSLLGFAAVDESFEGRFDGRVLACAAGAGGHLGAPAAALKYGAESYYDETDETRLRERLERLGYL